MCWLHPFQPSSPGVLNTKPAGQIWPMKLCYPACRSPHRSKSLVVGQIARAIACCQIARAPRAREHSPSLWIECTGLAGVAWSSAELSGPNWGRAGWCRAMQGQLGQRKAGLSRTVQSGIRWSRTGQSTLLTSREPNSAHRLAPHNLSGLQGWKTEHHSSNLTFPWDKI